METIGNMRWGTKSGRTGDSLNSTKGKKGFQSTVEPKGLIGERECHCTQYCDIPDIFCTSCEGTGTIQRLQAYLKEHGMQKTTLKVKRKNRTNRVRG